MNNERRDEWRRDSGAKEKLLANQYSLGTRDEGLGQVCGKSVGQLDQLRGR